MSARRVCMGTRPSRYHSVRAISMPFRRPEDMILMPWAPRRMAFCMARFMARRNMMRFSSCWVMLSAINWASTSGLRTSSMFTETGTFRRLASSAFRFSMSSPFLPITTPGRAEKMVIRALLAGRSIKIRDTAAFFSFFFRNSRTSRSSASIEAKLRLVAYQRDAQLRVTARRKPVGWIFCPMISLCLVAHGHINVAGRLADAIATALCAGGETLQRGALLHIDGLDLQFVDVSTVILLGVGDCRLQSLLDDASGLLLGEFQNVQGLVHLLAADQVSDQTTLVDRQTNTANDCFGFHRRCSLFLGFLVAWVTLERTRQGELAELVANHLILDVHGHVLLAVVHSNGQADELRQDGGTTRPGLDRLLVFCFDSLFNLGQQMMVNERTLFQRTSHFSLPLTFYDATQ